MTANPICVDACVKALCELALAHRKLVSCIEFVQICVKQCAQYESNLQK